MARISDTVTLKCVIPGDDWDFGYTLLDISIIYDRQDDYFVNIIHKGCKFKIITLWGESLYLINDVVNCKNDAMINQERITNAIYWATEKNFIKWSYII